MKNYVYIIIIIGLFTSCVNKGSNSRLDSDDYENKVERIEILEKAIKSFSDIQDTEFELFNVNGFHNQRTLLPGASSWDYRFVIRVNINNISKWTQGMTEIQLDGYDGRWTKEITKHRKENWVTHSKPKYFVRKGENVTMIVFSEEGIIFKRVINL